jgi:hypothetical protein
VEDNRKSAQFRRASDQVQKIGGNEDKQSQAKSQTGTNNREDRFMCNYGDSTAHFHVQNDCGSPKNDRPQQLIIEVCTCLRSEDNLPKIKKASQGRHNAQGDAQVLLHNELLVFSSALRISVIRCFAAEIAVESLV